MRAIDFSRLVENGLETRAYRVIKKKTNFLLFLCKRITRLQEKKNKLVTIGREFIMLYYVIFLRIFHLCYFYNNIISM